MKPLQLSKPHVIVMVGIPGSGKTFFAEHFATTFNASLLSYEKLEEALFKVPARSSVEQAASRRVADYILEELLKSKQTVVFDGPAGTKTDRAHIFKLAKNAGYEPLLVWVQTESLAARARFTRKKTGTPLHTPKQFEDSLKRFTPPSSTEKVVVISGKHTYASQLKIILKHLVEPRVDAAQELSHNPRPTDGRRITIR